MADGALLHPYPKSSDRQLFCASTNTVRKTLSFQMLRCCKSPMAFYVLNDIVVVRFTARLACVQAGTVGNVLHARVSFCSCIHSHSRGNQSP
jgi:hypothetical protein